MPGHLRREGLTATTLLSACTILVPQRTAQVLVIGGAGRACGARAVASTVRGRGGVSPEITNLVEEAHAKTLELRAVPRALVGT